MSIPSETLNETDKVIIIRYQNVDAVELVNKVDSSFKNRGYKIEGGTPGNGTYEKGNYTLRLLFGAMVKYNKFALQTEQNEDTSVTLRIERKTSGMSGGLIGINQVKKEMKEIGALLRSF